MAGVPYPQSTSPAHFHLPGLCISVWCQFSVTSSAWAETLVVHHSVGFPVPACGTKRRDRRSSVAAYLPNTAASAVFAKADKEISHSGETLSRKGLEQTGGLVYACPRVRVCARVRTRACVNAQVCLHRCVCPHTCGCGGQSQRLASLIPNLVSCLSPSNIATPGINMGAGVLNLGPQVFLASKIFPLWTIPTSWLAVI